jgi:hypothetical protein
MNDILYSRNYNSLDYNLTFVAKRHENSLKLIYFNEFKALLIKVIQCIFLVYPNQF